MSNVIDGKQVAADTRASVAAAVSTLGFTPTLAVVLVGDDPASQVYVRNKIKFTEETGMRSVEHRLSAESTETEVVEIVRALNADTDVDGILVQILAKAALGDLTGKHCVVLGRSILVGKPAALMFLEQNCTVTIAHSRTEHLPVVCRSADILVAAVGRPQMVQDDWIKAGACVIDVGINRVPSIKRPGKSRLVGDVDYKPARAVAGAITPVPTI